MKRLFLVLILLGSHLEAQSIYSTGGGGSGTPTYPLAAPAADNCATPPYSFTSDTDTGICSVAVDTINFRVGGTNRWYFDTTGFFRPSTGNTLDIGASAAGEVRSVYVATTLGLSDNAATLKFGGSLNAGLEWLASSVIGVTDGSTGDGWIQNSAGDQFLTANATNATTTFSNLTDLTVTVTTGRKYNFEMTLFVDNSTDTDGIKLDFEGGTATATDFRAHTLIHGSAALLLTTQVTALATDISLASLVGVGQVKVSGSFEPSGTGTFIPRFATVTAVSGTLTVFRGSNLIVKDMP